MDRSRLDQVLDVGMMRSQQPDEGVVFGTGNFGEIHDLATLTFLKMEVMQHRKQATDYYAGPRHRTMSLVTNYHATLKALDDEERDLDKRIAEVSPRAKWQLDKLKRRVETKAVKAELGEDYDGVSPPPYRSLQAPPN